MSASPRIAFDVSALDPNFKAHAQRGIGRYVSELVKYFDSQGYPVQRFDHATLPARSPFLKTLDLASRISPLGRKTLRQQFLYPMKLGRADFNSVEAIHFPAHMDAPSWSSRPCIVTVLDLIPLVLADLYKAEVPSWRFRLARHLEIRAIKNASLILAISECTARDVQRVLGIPRERIVVTPLGVGEEFFAAQKVDESELRGRFGIPENRKIVLYVGGIDPRKNTRTMLKSFAELSGRLSLPPVLLLCGRIQSDKEFPKLERSIVELGLTGSVIMPGYVSDQDLRGLFSISSVFFFPSLYEGFGLPPLEAMAAGLPVVSSNSSSMPEILGDSAILVDPNDVSGFASALESVLLNDELAKTMSISGVQQARLFTWARTGESTVDAYRTVNQRTAK